LVEIGFRIGVDLFAGKRRAGFGLSRGIADERGEITDQENRSVAQVLKMLELSKDHGVAEVKIGGGGIEAELHAQGLAGLSGFFELGGQLRFGNDFHYTFFQVGELLFDGFEIRMCH